MKIPAAAAAAVSLVLAAVFASTTLSGGGSAGSSTACGNGWAPTATGKPAALSSGKGRSFYVWRDASGWHLRALGASRSAPLAGRIQADARLRVVVISRAMRSGLKTSARAVSFRVSSAGLARLELRSPCATRLSFRVSGSPRVYLGSSGKAPAPAFSLKRPAATGVGGRILVSRCPVVGAGCPPAKPTTGTVRIETAPTEKGTSGHVVARVRSDANGSYSADLSPGRYLLVVEKPGYPAQKAWRANVERGVVTLTNLFVDTGIR